MVLKLTLKSMMHSKELINVELYNVISNFQLDLISNIKVRMQLMNNLMLLLLKRSKQNKPWLAKFLQKMIWMIMNSNGKSKHLNQVLRDQLLFIELFLARLRDLWQF